MEVIPQFNARKDMSAYETRTRLRVTVRPVKQEIEGALVPQGTHLVDVPASRVRVVMGLVETEEDRQVLKLARESHERGLAAWLEKGHAAETYGGSVEAEFYKMRRRSVPPLTACEVVEEGIAPPLTEAEQREVGMLSRLASLMKAEAPAAEQRGGKR